MTQTSLKLIVPLPENDVTGFRRASLSRVCGGNDTIADVLNFFVYKASGLAQHLNLEEVDFVRIERCSLDDITERVKVSKRTLHGYIKQLEAWEYVKAYPYHQTYDIYFHTITDALANPPAPPPPKPRGRHALRALSLEEQMSKLQSRYAELEEEMSNLTFQMSKLTFQKSNLTSQKLDLTFEMSKLTFQKSNLTSSKSCEDASEQGVMGDFDEDRILEEKESREESKEGEEEDDHEEPTPFSCSRSLSSEIDDQEPEQVATRSISLQRVGTSLKDVHTKPSWIKTDTKAVSKKPAATYTKKLVPPPLEEARPLTKNAQRSLNEQECSAIWQEVEAAYGQPFDEEDRKAPKNIRGMAILRKKNVDALMIRDTIDAMDDFEIRSFNLTLLAERMTTLEALRKRKAQKEQQQGKKEGPSKKLSQAEIDALPPPSPECLVPWGIYTDLGLYWWQDQYRTLEEADALGFNGGFGYYHHQKAPPSWREEEEEACNVS